MTGQIPPLPPGYSLRDEDEPQLPPGYSRKPPSAQPQKIASQPQQEGFGASLLHAVGLPASREEVPAHIQGRLQHMANVVSEGQNPVMGLIMPTPNELRPQIAEAAGKTGSEVKQTVQSVRQGDLPGALGHTVGTIGYGAATLLTPVGGSKLIKAGEQFGSGNISGGLGTTTGVIAPIVIGGRFGEKASPPAAEVLPRHVEALTSLIDDRGGTVDPHVTASDAIPHLRETAARMRLDPSALKGREAGQAAIRVADKAVSDVQNEFDTIRQPYNTVLVEQRPIADAYRSAITDEIRANAPEEAHALEAEAKKFDQPAPLQQVNQFRVRMNRKLDAFENREQGKQIMSDEMTRAHKAAANAARELEYDTVGRLSGLDSDYVRGLKQREGSLIEAERSLRKTYYQASGAQGEASSKTLREKVANTYPSPRGIKHAGIKEVLGPKPINVLNNRLSSMFSDLGPASELPRYEVQPPLKPTEAPIEPDIDQITRRPNGLQPPVGPDIATRETVAKNLKQATTPKPPVNISPENQQLILKAKYGENWRSQATLEELGKASKAQVTAGGQITPEHVAEENAFYTQARSELGANADPITVLRRAQELKTQAQAQPPAPKSTLTQRVQAQPLPTLRRLPSAGLQPPSGASRQAQAASIMLAAKQGLLSPSEADRQLKLLVGRTGGRVIKQPRGKE